MTAREAADTLGVSERTVRRWIKSGELDAAKQGGAFMVDLDAAREVFTRSRAGRSASKSAVYAELNGRYLEVCERLEETRRDLAAEQIRRARLEVILYPPLPAGPGASVDE